MDQITHEVRLANWKKIIEQCNCRPDGMTVKQWFKDNGISNKSYYYWLRRIRLEAYAQLAASPQIPRYRRASRQWHLQRSRYRARRTGGTNLSRQMPCSVPVP